MKKKVLTDQHYMLLGKIAVSAARLEDIWSSILGDLIDPDSEFSSRITGSMAFDKTVGLAVSLAEVKLDENDLRLANFKRRADQSRKAMRERNEILHGRWVSADDGAGGSFPAIRTRTRKGHLQIRMFAEISELEAVQSSIAETAGLMELVLLGSAQWNGSFQPYDDRGHTGMRRIVPAWRKAVPGTAIDLSSPNNTLKWVRSDNGEEIDRIDS